MWTLSYAIDSKLQNQLDLRLLEKRNENEISETRGSLPIGGKAKNLTVCLRASHYLLDEKR